MRRRTIQRTKKVLLIELAVIAAIVGLLFLQPLLLVGLLAVGGFVLVAAWWLGFLAWAERSEPPAAPAQRDASAPTDVPTVTTPSEPDATTRRTRERVRDETPA